MIFAWSDFVKALGMLTDAGRTACYNALRLDGRFAKSLRETRGFSHGKVKLFVRSRPRTVREQIADRFLFVRSFPRDVNGRTVRASARQSNYEHRMMAFVSAY
jgi:hypothetical protein